ncbi:carbohydrate-binding protein [Paenibacillus rhizoplanae]
MYTKVSARAVSLLAAFALLLSVFFTALPNANAAARGAWSPNTAYAVNDTVTYGGGTYTCLQAHTSLTGWEPPNVPALWKKWQYHNTHAHHTPSYEWSHLLCGQGLWRQGRHPGNRQLCAVPAEQCGHSE